MTDKKRGFVCENPQKYELHAEVYRTDLLPLLRGVFVGAQIPSIDQIALGRIDLAFLFDLLDADPQTVLGEDDVLLAHSFRDLAPHLGHAEVDLIADPGSTSEDSQKDDEWEKLAKCGHISCQSDRQGFTCGDVRGFSLRAAAEDVKVPT